MPRPDFVPRLLESYRNTFHGLLKSTTPLGDWVYMWSEKRKTLLAFLVEDAATPEVGLSPDQLRAVEAELARPHPEDAVLVFDVHDVGMRSAWIDRARIALEAPLRRVLDARNHFPMPWPAEWHGPYKLDIGKDVYRIDTPDCSLIARVESEAWDYSQIDDEGIPRHFCRLELGVTRAFDSAVASDAQVAAITSRFRHCGAWSDQTHQFPRRHPSRRVFHAEVGWHDEGTPWPEVQPLPEMMGPPPGWEPVGSFQDRPLMFRIEGTDLEVEWAPPPGVDAVAAAQGRLEEKSRFEIRAAKGRRATDAEVGTVFAMLGGARFEEEERGGGGGGRVFRATAGWLRKVAGRG